MFSRGEIPSLLFLPPASLDFRLIRWCPPSETLYVLPQRPPRSPADVYPFFRETSPSSFVCLRPLEDSFSVMVSSRSHQSLQSEQFRYSLEANNFYALESRLTLEEMGRCREYFRCLAHASVAQGQRIRQHARSALRSYWIISRSRIVSFSPPPLLSRLLPPSLLSYELASSSSLFYSKFSLCCRS